ncbi:hypothetical protein GCM10027187_39870 [Streptosporangium sandarakinum]
MLHRELTEAIQVRREQRPKPTRTPRARIISGQGMLGYSYDRQSVAAAETSGRWCVSRIWAVSVAVIAAALAAFFHYAIFSIQPGIASENGNALPLLRSQSFPMARWWKQPTR